MTLRRRIEYVVLVLWAVLLTVAMVAFILYARENPVVTFFQMTSTAIQGTNRASVVQINMTGTASVQNIASTVRVEVNGTASQLMQSAANANATNNANLGPAFLTATSIVGKATIAQDLYATVTEEARRNVTIDPVFLTATEIVHRATLTEEALQTATAQAQNLPVLTSTPEPNSVP